MFCTRSAKSAVGSKAVTPQMSQMSNAYVSDFSFNPCLINVIIHIAMNIFVLNFFFPKFFFFVGFTLNAFPFTETKRTLYISVL